MTILYAALVLLVLAVLFGIAIVLVNKKFAVEVDPTVEQVNGLLAGANCGACGKAGCLDFAKALVEGTASLNDCNPTGKEDKEKIQQILGNDEALSEPVVVVDACCGGIDCQDKYEYQGYGDCQSIELLAGGRKACPVGCMGMGTCVRACPYDAISIKKGIAIVDQTRCEQCGLCLKRCPKKLLKYLPQNAVYYVACSSCEKGKDVRAVCARGCIACGLCARSCPEGAIEMVDNLPVFNYKKCTACGICKSKCPTKCILKLGEEHITSV